MEPIRLSGLAPARGRRVGAAAPADRAPAGRAPAGRAPAGRTPAGLATVGLATVVLAALLLSLPGAARAQDGAAGETAELVEALRDLIEKGRSERLADPWYLRELEDLAARYDRPWQRLLLSDDFSGRGATPEAPWQVTEPEWMVDWRHGLRSVVTPPAPPAETAGRERGGDSVEDAAKQIIGGLLQEALRGEQGERRQDREQQPAAPADDPDFAAVTARVAITNAFALEVELSRRALAEVTAPRLELGVYQGERIDAGYRLVVMPGDGGTEVRLLKLSPRGTVSTLEKATADATLADGAAHRLAWTRDRGGRMEVSLNGTTLFSLRDRGYNDPFDGLVAINGGGDFALRRVALKGTPAG